MADIFESMRKAPFNLGPDQEAWVKETFAKMDLKAKVGQLFCLAARSNEEQWVNDIFDICEPCGFMYRPMPIDSTIYFSEMLAKKATIPMLIAADVEKGGNGLISDKGTLYGSPMCVAATGEAESAANLGDVCGAECEAIGGNWAFAPIIDIDFNWRNPMTNIRTFGSDPKRVADFGAAYVKACQSHGVATSIKHFPGDGRDERDHHLVTTVNDLSAEDWMATYGAAYKAGIEAGSMTVMVGHIMQPAWTRKLCPGIADEDIMPATLAPELVNGLLRGELGFNGLTVTDATTMNGFSACGPRSEIVPKTIAAGCDVFLFSKNLKEDFDYMMQGIEKGLLTMERVDEAVLRILGFKAALRLYEKKIPTIESASAVVGCEKHHRLAKECADKAVTIVKEEKGVLPLTVEKYPRIMVYPVETVNGLPGYNPEGPTGAFIKKLEEKGFKVSVFEPKMGIEGRFMPSTYVTDACDAIIYVANCPTKSNQTTVRITWQDPIGCNCPIYRHEKPTIFVSLENPYHLMDVPRIRTYINAYCATNETISAVIEKLMGESEFKGVSPVDPFCGRWDTHLN